MRKIQLLENNAVTYIDESTVLNIHRFHSLHWSATHTLYECTCGQQSCMFCEGGLGFCNRCHGFEGTMPFHCPGYPMPSWLQSAVYRHTMDFVDGLWRFGNMDRFFDYCLQSLYIDA